MPPLTIQSRRSRFHNWPLPPGGEAAGLQRLAVFTRPDGPIAGYHRQRDLPALSGTSQLSPYLHLGCVAPAAALRAAQQAATNPLADAGAAIWISELAWRDFYYQIMYHFPHVLRRAFRPQYDALAWENNEDLFAAWCAGRTGYPIVDAAMRQLRNEAWMHNRCRMIVASFLCKNLLIDWRWGEHYFMQQLVDGDRAANNGGWQWAAGTGTDAQPYFRIFNPTSQGEKFDPQGDYVRRYVPELRSVASRYIHQPWAMPPTEQQRVGVWIGKEYPLPIVDHGERRRAALELYRAVR
ncbi:MAG TPA: FAD-binding domain-containing protein [Roseiflexaceae bacterium]|nr:FAD-binding domain-containing protein [Roseiflexaceae bacterium]